MYQVGGEQPTDENGPSFLGAPLSTLCMTFQVWEMTIPVLPSPLTNTEVRCERPCACV